MGLGTNTGARTTIQGLRYKGGTPMWSFLLHRISGIGIIVFVAMHVVASFALQRYGSGAGKAIEAVYESWPFQAFIYFCIIFHALNGARIIVLDLWPQLLQYQREATWLQWLTFAPIYGLTLVLLVQRGLSGG
jgi:succinate dehydrogenase / fumarate reductase cytochrome b subunit